MLEVIKQLNRNREATEGTHMKVGGVLATELSFNVTA